MPLYIFFSKVPIDWNKINNNLREFGLYYDKKAYPHFEQSLDFITQIPDKDKYKGYIVLKNTPYYDNEDESDEMLYKVSLHVSIVRNALNSVFDTNNDESYYGKIMGSETQKIIDSFKNKKALYYTFNK